MKPSAPNIQSAPRFGWRLGAVVGAIFVISLILVPKSAAAFEQLDSFGEGSEGNLGSATAPLAVNISGAGGVPAGTVFAGRFTYNAKGQFRSELGAAYLPFSSSAAVDQATGNLYGPVVSAKSCACLEPNEVNIKVFSSDGAHLVASFGEQAEFGDSIESSPEKFHSLFSGAVAVNPNGDVYVADVSGSGGVDGPGSFGSRVMIFEPENGNFEHYVYTGRGNDIVKSKNGSGYFVRHIALDDAGDLYGAAANGEDIYEFALSSPSVAKCEFHFAKGGIEAITVNPVTGELFFYTKKDGTIRRLSACNSEGRFTEIETITVMPQPVVNTGQIQSLGFDPGLSYEEGRPAGILYAIDNRGSVTGGRIFAPAKVSVPPTVGAESVSAVTATTATLGARVDPRGSPTRYAFQYLTEAEYEANEPGVRFAGAREAPLGGAALQEASNVSIAVSGLASDTEYRYRAVATSHCEPGNEAVCERVGPDARFRTFPAEAAALPDHRVYELVSPVEKRGGEPFPLNPETGSCGGECKPGSFGQSFPRQSSVDGEAVVYEGQPFSESEGANVFNEYLSRRTPSGWQTTVLAPSLMGAELQGYRTFDRSLTQGVLYQELPPSLAPAAPSNYANLYVQPTAAPSVLTALISLRPPNRPPIGGEHFKLAFAGASDDFSSFIFAANDALTGETTYAPAAVDGGPEKKNLYQSTASGLQLVNVLPGNTATAPGAYFGAKWINNSGAVDSISDLSHAISEDGERVFWSDGSGQVYVRVNGEYTIEIPDHAKFLTASADGSEVLLRDGHLYDVNTGATTDLTEGQGGFQGIVGQSEDLSSIYFVDTASLAGEAQLGEDNLYAWKGGALSFVATLLPADNSSQPIGGDWNAAPSQRTAEASPDGRWLAFLSKAPLTGYDNEGEEEVFLYDSASGRLFCASCNPSGAPPLGRSTLPVVPNPPTSEDPIAQPRFLLEAGRLYFDSRDSLSPADTNNGVEDTYQYEPRGEGSCEREGGCVNLISAGREPVDSNFLAVDETGRNVFFTTRDRLTPKDHDDLIDVYDARVEGGIAAESETARSECKGETCQASPGPPAGPAPASATLKSSGNVKAGGKCPKGKAKYRGKCVSKHKGSYPKRKHRRHKTLHSSHDHGRANGDRRTSP